MTNDFKDLFSKQAVDYSRYRPTYPPALFDFLASTPATRSLAWDCGTGNGQAALALADRFAGVIATDPSPQQLEQAPPHPKITYRRSFAEDSGIASGAIDLTTVAQALHWFKQLQFFDEVKRVSRPTGARLAVWSYTLAQVNHEVDERIKYFYNQIVGKYWEPERRLVEEGYRSVQFPFKEIQTPPFAMEHDWDFSQLLGYLGTWSATQACARAENRNPVKDFSAELMRVWGPANEYRKVRWPLSLRVFAIEPA